MTKNMLIDATHSEETRVAVVEGDKLLEFDYESKFRKPLKGSIFLAKVTRVEPSLQAAFVNFGGNRHGFLPFSEIHPDYFRIPIADREALLAEQQAAIEEMDKQEDIHEQEPAQGDEQAGGGMSRHDESMDHREESAAAPEGETAVEEVAEEEGGIEEIGGGQAGFHDHAGESRHENIASTEVEFASDEFAGDSFSGDESAAEGEPTDETQMDANPEGGSSEGQDQEGRFEGRGGRGGGRGRGRFRGRGRHNGGGGRGRHRMAHGSRRVESFGGEEYEGGGDRFRFNLRRKYKIQEVIKRGQIMLVQVSKEERGNKGAAVSTYLSLPGRYCVLMPNSPRAGGVSRKIASYQDRARMREILKEIEVPQGMSVIVRTAGVARSMEEIKRDLDYLMRLWDNIRELTLQSSAPAMVYGEADLIKRAVRDLYSRDIDEVIVAGHEGFETARNYMKMLAPENAERVVEFEGSGVPLFHKYHVEDQIAEIGEGQVTLPSGGYLVINQTEALVAIDVNSGKATKERHIEETALKTNMEAASEVARQLRLRDLGGLIVIDFIDMEDRRNNAKVERRVRDALSTDRARIQMGRISSFGLMELSRQRLNPSLNESQFEICKHCNGMGRTRTCDATSIMALRAIEEEGMSGRGGQIIAHVSNEVALYILNNKRKHVLDLEARYGITVLIRADETVGVSSFRIENLRPQQGEEGEAAPQGERVTSEARPPREEGGEGRYDRDRGERGTRGRRGGRGRGRGRDREEGRGDRFESPRRPDVPFTPEDAQPEFGAPQDASPAMDDDFNADIPLDDESENFGNRQEYHGGDRFKDEGRPGRGPDRGDRGGRGGGASRGRRGGGRGRGRDNRAEGGRGRTEGRNGGGRDNFRRDSFAEEGAGIAREPSFDPPPPQNFNETPAPVEAMRSEPAQAERPRRRQANDEAAAEQHARSFEKVNEAPKEKKRGWWNRGGE